MNQLTSSINKQMSNQYLTEKEEEFLIEIFVAEEPHGNPSSEEAKTLIGKGLIKVAASGISCCLTSKGRRSAQKILKERADAWF